MYLNNPSFPKALVPGILSPFLPLYGQPLSWLYSSFMCRDSHLLLLKQHQSHPLSHYLQDHTQDVGTCWRILNPNIPTPEHSHPYIPLLPLFTTCRLSKTSDYQCLLIHSVHYFLPIVQPLCNKILGFRYTV